MFFVALLLASFAQLEITPIPQSLSIDERRVFAPTPGMPVVISDSADDALRDHAAMLSEASGMRLPVIRAADFRGDENAIFVGAEGDHDAFERRKLRRAINSLIEPGAQGYRLVIEGDLVVLAGTDVQGVHHGLETLIEIARNGAPWRCLSMRDAPQILNRAVLYTGPPDDEVAMRSFAASKANAVIMDHEDFLTGNNVDAWRRTFGLARALGMQPIPMVRPLRYAAANRPAPAAPEVREHTEFVTLDGDNMALLAKRGIVGDTSDVQVTHAGLPLRAGIDYVVDDGGGATDFAGLPWTIRRVAGGGIPDGATVEVRYRYEAAPDTPLGPAPVEARDVLTQFAELLGATSVHIAHDDLHALVESVGTERPAVSLPQLFVASVRDWADAAIDVFGEDGRVLVYADGVSAWRDLGLNAAAVCGELPDNVIIHQRDDPAALCGERVTWFEPAATPAAAYALATAFEGAEPSHGGVILDGRDGGAMRVGLAKAWRTEAPRLAWPEGLNALCGSALWQPGPDEARQALVAWVNDQVLKGVPPEEMRDTFDDAARSVRARLADNDSTLQFAAQQAENLFAYVELEREFAEEASDGAVRKLTDLVEAQAALSPDWPADRAQRIVETVSDQRLFVPPTILFGAFVRPYRALTLPRGSMLLPYPGEPTFTFNDSEVIAGFDFTGSIGPVARFDFEAAQVTGLRVERTLDGVEYSTVHSITADEGGWLTGPLIVSPAPEARRLRVVASGPTERTVLRNVQAVGVKSPAVSVCGSASREPVVDGQLDAAAWPEATDVSAFVRTGERAFAQAQTEARFLQTRSGIYALITAFEPRMDTMEGAAGPRDTAVWEKEALELRFRTGDRDVYRLLVSPTGAIYDSLNGDAFWDGDWEIAVYKGAEMWQVEAFLPATQLDTRPRAGATWDCNVIRHRYNVFRETSTWAVSDKAEGAESAWGTLAFN